jgi:hypothetical protein
MGLPQDVDDILYCFISFRRYINIGAVCDRAFETDFFVWLFSYALRHHQVKGAFMTKHSLSLYPWYYSYGSALVLRGDVLDKRLHMKDWEPADTLTPTVFSPGVPWGHFPHEVKTQDIFYYLPHFNSPGYGLDDIGDLVLWEKNWLRGKRVVDEGFEDFIVLVDIGLKHEGLLFNGLRDLAPHKHTLCFGGVDQGSFAVFYLHSGLSFIFEDHINRSSRLDTLGFIGFILSYDLGIVR